jgi:hypothetical protein
MKKTILILALVVLAAIPIGAAYNYSKLFITAGVSCNASSTVNNDGKDFTSINVGPIPNDVNTALLTLTFTRATGSATLAVDFYFQVSYDNGTTWADLHDAVSDADYLSVLTGHAVVTGTTVRVSRTIILNGVSHIRLSKIVNNDSGNNLTACNATISW